MRNAYLALGVALLCNGALGAPPPPQHTVVHLDAAAALAELKATNPDHYARARGIMAAANHLCRAGPPNVFFTRYQARDVACARFQIYTSLPPKRRLSFTLDDTSYVALVVLTDHPGRTEPVR
jgi:hypothetical protein